MKKYSVALVGIGLVGTRILEVIRERGFPTSQIKVFGRRARTETIDGVAYEVTPAAPDVFDGMDLALFAGTEGAKGASQLYGWEAVKRGCVVVDNGDDFRMDERVPLVIPEVNPDALRDHQGFVSNPNCSTIQMVMALAPLHRAVPIRRIVATTFQSVSGTGRAAVDELDRQVRDVPAGGPARPEQYPYQIFANVIPQIGSLRRVAADKQLVPGASAAAEGNNERVHGGPAAKKEAFPGYYSEEVKLIRETRKILGAPDLAVSATCARVPVAFGHSEALNVEFERKLSAGEAREILSAAPGVTVVDDPAASKYPIPIDAAGKDDVFVGRIREDPCRENTLDVWCVSDNIRKGAATNAVQIAEKLIEMELLRAR